MSTIINASTSSGLIQTADTSGTLELQSNATTKFTVSSTGAYGQVVSGTAVTASGTSVNFTSIPSWVKRITVSFSAVSTNGTSDIYIRVGSGSLSTSGYLGSRTSFSSTTLTVANTTAGFEITTGGAAAGVVNGSMVLTLIGSNTWAANGASFQSNTTRSSTFGGSIALSGALDLVSVLSQNGTDTFDAGSINILYEG